MSQRYGNTKNILHSDGLLSNYLDGLVPGTASAALYQQMRSNTRALFTTVTDINSYAYQSKEFDFLDGYFKTSPDVISATFAGLSGVSFSRASAAWSRDSGGTYSSFASGNARINSRGFKIEGSATNLSKQSNGFSTTPTWSASSVGAINSAAQTAPDGTNTGWKMVSQSAGGTTNRLAGSVTVASVQNKMSMSCFAKKAECRYLKMQCRSGVTAGNQPLATFDLQAGTCTTSNVGNGTTYSARMTAVANGWYFCEMVAQASNADVGTTIVPLIGIAGTSTGGNFTGDGTSGLYIWQFDIKEANFQTSPITTTTATATRSADVARLAASGTMPSCGLVKFTLDTLKDTGKQVVMQWDDASENNRATLYYDPASGHVKFDVYTSGSAQCSLDLGAAAYNTDYRVAFRAVANDFSASINGGAVVTDNSGTIPTTTDRSFGHDSANASHLDGVLGRVLESPVAKVNADLVTWSAAA